MAYRRINLPLLRNFVDNFGHLDVPQKFAVPHEISSWKEEFHGVKIGKYVNRLRKQLKSGDVFVEEDVKEVLSLGLALDSFAKKRNLILSAFQFYRVKHPEHKYVHRDYKIDKDTYRGQLR